VKRFSKRTVQLFVAGLFIALAALGVTLLKGRSADGGGPAWVDKNIQDYQATLAVSADPTEQAFLEQKLAAMQQIEKNRVQALDNLPTKPVDPCSMRPTPEPTTVRATVAGISQVDSVPISPDDFTPTNQWQGEWADLWVRVYAGANPNEAEQGVLWVVVDNSGDYGSYDAPTQGGALTIIAANGLVLTLQDASGATLYFDVASRKLVNSPTTVASTLVPMPTFTPDTGSCPADLP
jgi:hypothetical protein